jgi:hypothetical protein
MVFFNKKVISRNFANFLNLKVFLKLGVCRACSSIFSRKEGGIQVLDGLAPSSQTGGALLRNPFHREKYLSKGGFSELTLMGKNIQLLLIKCIWQSQKFDKVGFCRANVIKHFLAVIY